MRNDWSFETAQVKLSRWMAPFADMFTAPTWQRVLVLLIAAVLSPGCRTVAAALRVTGLDQDPHFTNYHRVLNRSRWSSRRVAVPVPPAGRHLRSERARHRRPRRHVGTTLGRQDRGPRDLSRSDPVEPWSLCQSERPALAFGHDAAGDCLGGARLGTAVPDRTGAVRRIDARGRAAHAGKRERRAVHLDRGARIRQRPAGHCAVAGTGRGACHQAGGEDGPVAGRLGSALLSRACFRPPRRGKDAAGG